MFLQNFQIPCVFPDREYFWLFFNIFGYFQYFWLFSIFSLFLVIFNIFPIFGYFQYFPCFPCAVGNLVCSQTEGQPPSDCPCWTPTLYYRNSDTKHCMALVPHSWAGGGGGGIGQPDLESWRAEISTMCYLTFYLV